MEFQSVAGLVPFPGRAAYGCSKAALTLYAGILAQEHPSVRRISLGLFIVIDRFLFLQLDLSVIHPGMIDTPPVHDEYEDDVIRANALSPADLARDIIHAPLGVFSSVPISGFIVHVLYVLFPAFYRSAIHRILPPIKQKKV